MPPLSHLTSCIPTKPNSLAAVVSESSLYSLLTFQVPNLMPLLHCLFCTKVSVPVQGTCLCFVTMPVFYGEELSVPRPIPKLEDHPLYAVRDCLFNIFAATLHIVGRSSICDQRTRHGVVKATQLSVLRKTTGIIIDISTGYETASL